MKTADISIIILAKNEERYIGSCLEMVFRQDIDKEFEVIIIDSGSQDSTLAIAKRFPVKIEEISNKEFGHGRTRNYGVQMASGGIVVFLNADAIPKDEQWLKSLIDNFKNDEKIAGVYSRILPHANCNPLHFWEILSEYSSCGRQEKYIEDFDIYHKMDSRKKRQFLAFQTISCAIKKDTMLKYPFENIEFGEDLEWSKRILEKGFRIIFEPQSAVLHSHNFYFSFKKTLKKYFDDAKLNKHLLNIWPRDNLPILAGYIAFKMFKDIRFILTFNRGALYKINWLIYSPFIRLAEFLGIILGANSRYLPVRLQNRLSLVNEIKN